MLPIQRQISDYNHYSSGSNNIKYIVLHYTANQNGTAKNHADYIGRSDVGASAHYFVDDNSIYQVIEDDCGAWHVGDGHGVYGISNTNSIGIEMCCMSPNMTISEQTEDNTLELVRYLMKKYNIDINNVVRHYDASKKVCPNWSENNWSRWDNFKNKLSIEKEDEELMDVKEIFCESWYLKNYPDVAAAVKRGELTAKQHYEQYGKKEGRKPNAGVPDNWNEGYYLLNNPDVNRNVSSASGYVSGLHHYLLNGWKEKRKWTIPNIESKPVEIKEGKKYYRVVTNSYFVKENADKEVAELKEKGIESFIAIYEK